MVMAGSGNLKVLQLCRFLHKRTFGEMNYGFHMAHHMALGLLFLGGGRLVEFEFCHLEMYKSPSLPYYPAPQFTLLILLCIWLVVYAKHQFTIALS